MANTFVNKKADLSSTSATTIYTVPSATTAVIKSILVSEDSGNADTITVTITDTSDAVFSLFKTKSISANGTVELGFLWKIINHFSILFFGKKPSQPGSQSTSSLEFIDTILWNKPSTRILRIMSKPASTLFLWKITFEQYWKSSRSQDFLF